MAGGWSYLYTYLQSNLLEVLIFIWFYRPRARGFFVTTFANAVTHPVVFFGFMISGWPFFTAILAAEAFAVLAETGLHWRFGRLKMRSAFLASLAANLFSWQVAPMLTYRLFMG